MGTLQAKHVRLKLSLVLILTKAALLPFRLALRRSGLAPLGPFARPQLRPVSQFCLPLRLDRILLEHHPVEFRSQPVFLPEEYLDAQEPPQSLIL